MCLSCSCIGKTHSERGEAAGTHASKIKFWQKVIHKCKYMFHKGQVEDAASSNEARAAARTTNTTAAGAIAIQLVVPPHQHSESQQGQSLNQEAAAQTENTIPPQQKSNSQIRSKPIPKKAIEARAKQLVDSSSKRVKNSVEIFPSSEDEDVCPTCLEEYGEENPKITTQCHHHYHLPCILEWMHRSPLCPVCSKLMVFKQMT